MHRRGQADQFLLLYLCSTCWPGTNLGRLHNFQTIIARIIGWETVPWPYRRVWSMVVNIYLGPFYRCTLKHLTPAQLSRKSPQGEELMMIPASDEIHCSPPAPAPQLPYMEQFRRPHCGRNHN